MTRQRPIGFRLLSLLVAGSLLATAGVDAFGAHRCPHHDALPAEADAGNVAVHDGHDGASGGATAVQSADGVADHDDHSPCSCVGQCPVSAGPALATAGSAWRSGMATAAAAADFVAHSDAPSGKPAHFIPFATAPPVSFAV
jgi:hypothetical protein